MTEYFEGAQPSPRCNLGLDFFGKSVYIGAKVMRISSNLAAFPYGSVWQVVDIDGDLLTLAIGELILKGDSSYFVVIPK